MVDNLTPAAPPQGDPPRGGVAGFFSTRAGKFVAGGVILAFVLAAIGAIVFIFVLQPSEKTPKPVVPPAGSVTTTGTASDDGSVPVERPAKPLSSTFVFRDIFMPSLKPSVVPSDSTGAGGGGTGGGGAGGGTSGGGTAGGDGSTPNVPPDTLFLQSVDTVDGVSVANLVWNNQTFAVAAGEELSGTPWKVISISGNTVVLLFGDTRVTLSVGQGLTK